MGLRLSGDLDLLANSNRADPNKRMIHSFFEARSDFPGRSTINMALREQDAYEAQRDSEPSSQGESRNVGDGLVDHRRQDQMGP